MEIAEHVKILKAILDNGGSATTGEIISLSRRSSSSVWACGKYLCDKDMLRRKVILVPHKSKNWMGSCTKVVRWHITPSETRWVKEYVHNKMNGISVERKEKFRNTHVKILKAILDNGGSAETKVISEAIGRPIDIFFKSLIYLYQQNLVERETIHYFIRTKGGKSPYIPKKKTRWYVPEDQMQYAIKYVKENLKDD